MRIENKKQLTSHGNIKGRKIVVDLLDAGLDSLDPYYRVKEFMQIKNGIGVHLEGPYLSQKNRGAQKLEELAVPSVDDYSYILDYADIIKTVTLAPELDGAAEMTSALTRHGIVVCDGHDDGIYPEFMPSIQNGLKHLTHVYSAMSEPRYIDGVRNLGLREYGLLDDARTGADFRTVR